MKKYTYDTWHYFSDGSGHGGGTGGTNLYQIRKTYKNFVKYYSKDFHLIIRRPDNKLMNFYSPYDGEGFV